MACSNCGTQNCIIIAYSGDYRANERETVECFSCDGHLLSEKCFVMYSGATNEDAIKQLRRMQGRS